MEKATTALLRIKNRNNIFGMIYEKKVTSKQEIASSLGLSLPTVSKNFKELEQLRLIEKNGYFESSGGRKPQAIRCLSQSRVAIGAEVTRNHLRVACVDLYGEVIKEERLRFVYEGNDAYYRRLGAYINEFAASLQVERESILGVGICIQGVVSADGTY